jgi:type IV secretion system protein VirB5
MRRFLLAATVGICLLGLEAPARAQIAVIDGASITQLLNQLQQLKQEYQATMGIFGSLLRAVDPNQVATNLIGSQPLPGGQQISQLLIGEGNFGSLSGLANQFLTANTVYTPLSTGSGDVNATLLQRSGNSLAGVQAMVQQSIQSIQQHILGLTQIQAQLSTVTTEADVSAVQGRLQAEQANLAAQGVQAQSLQTMLQAQQLQYQLQQQQMVRQAADSTVAYYGGAPQAPAAQPQVTAATIPTFAAGG